MYESMREASQFHRPSYHCACNILQLFFLLGWRPLLLGLLNHVYFSSTFVSMDVSMSRIFGTGTPRARTPPSQPAKAFLAACAANKVVMSSLEEVRTVQ